MKIAVVIASTGRPDDLARWSRYAAEQTEPPRQMIWSVAGNGDLPAPDAVDGRMHPLILVGPKGSCVQRNRAIDAVDPAVDLVGIFDDDYVPTSTCMEGIAGFFRDHPEVIAVSGKLLADGASGAGIGVEDAEQLVRTHRGNPATATFEEQESLYGCNMVCRAGVLAEERFDETLPLYGWLEDRDLAQRLKRKGLIGWTDAFVGVHRGAKGGRTSGTKLGYSQIANLMYLQGKGQGTRASTAKRVLQHLLVNHLRMVRPEPWIDRRGRAAGNRRAVLDLVRGRLHPGRVLDL